MVYDGNINEYNEKHGYGINIYDNGEIYEGNLITMLYSNVFVCRY